MLVVPLHHLHFLRGQRARFEKHAIRDADLAHIVQQRRHLQRIAFLRTQVQQVGPGRTRQRDAQRMGGRRGVLGPQGDEERAGQARAG